MPPLSATAKVPPSNAEAERSVLGCCLIDNQALAVVTSYLKTDDFYEPSHQLIYDMILTLYMDNRAVDTLTIKDALESSGQLDRAGGWQYIEALPDAVPFITRAREYAGIVRQKAVLRRLIQAVESVRDLAYQDQEDPDELLDLASQKIYEIRENHDVTGLEALGDIMSRTVNEIAELAEGKSGRRAVKTGYPSLDTLLGGLNRGTLNILAARPAMGKSALALNIAMHAALDSGLTCAVFSLEMSKEEIASRFLSAKAYVDSRKLKSGQVAGDDWDKLSEVLPQLYASKIFIDDTAATTPLTMLSSCRQLQIEHQLGLVVIDYMQLMSSQNNRGDNRQQEISDISRSLKLMAKELDVPVIALSQLSRACEARQDKHPVLSDLRDSGSIEQDADSVMFLFRPDYYVQDHLPQEVEEADLVVAKNRSGATGTVKLGWMPSYTLFVDLSRKEAPDDYVGTQAQDFDAPYELE
ncbi:MAG: replicative DNA helicase [Oscillospiraceae bacterium]|nr:replicative DNA helicase [Oscillospiraceae bacterium]